MEDEQGNARDGYEKCAHPFHAHAHVPVAAAVSDVTNGDDGFISWCCCWCWTTWWGKKAWADQASRTRARRGASRPRGRRGLIDDAAMVFGGDGRVKGE